MRYVIYARKSTEEDDRQVLSIEAQITELQEFAAREKLSIVASFQEAKTAKEPGRMKFAEMVSFLESGKADGIISWNPDRLARNSVDGGKIIHLVDRSIIKSMRFPTHWFEPTPQGLFMLQIAFGQSKYYVDNLSENVKRGLRQKIRRGEWPGWAPVGYVNNPKTHAIDLDPEKAPLVKKIFQLYATGAHTVYTLAEWCTKHGLTSNKGTNISPSKIYFMLQNIFYLGLMKYKGEVHEATHAPLISKKLFDQVQAVFKQRGKPRKKKKHSFMFLGLMKCTCGSGITAEVQKGHNYYRCTRKKGPCAEKHYLREELLATQIKENLQTIALPDEDVQKILVGLDNEQNDAKRQAQSSIGQFKTELQAVENQLEKLLDFFLADALSREEYAAKKQKLLTKKLELKEKIFDVEKKGVTWVEPAKEFILSLNEAKKILTNNKLEETTPFLKKSGSNHRLHNRRLTFSWQPPYNFVAEGRANAPENLTYSDWLPGSDSNRRPIG